MYAKYYHCSANVLNFALVNVSKLPVTRNMISTVKKITSFPITGNKKKVTLRYAINLSSIHIMAAKTFSHCGRHDGLNE
jgi:hypothetical protein